MNPVPLINFGNFGMWQSQSKAWLIFQPRNWQLAHQLLFSSLLTTLVLMVLAGGWISSVEEQRHNLMHEATLNEKLSLLKATSMEALLSRDVPVLETIVQAAGLRDKDVVALEIRDSDNRLLAQWQDETPSPEALKNVMATTVTLGDQQFGQILVTWDMADHVADVQKHTRWLFIILAAVLLLLTTILILLTRFLVVRPIQNIHKSMQAEIPPDVDKTFAARELQHLADAATVQLFLRSETRRSELRYRGLFDNMAAGCMVLSLQDDNFNIVDINESFRHLPFLDIGARQVEHLDEVIDEDRMAILYDGLRNTAATRVNCHIGEIPVRCGEHEYWLDCHIFTIESGELVLIVRDITENKISIELRRAKEAAEQANALKSAFLASMSHEIRTPLNGVLSMVELLRGTRLGNKQRHWVDAIRGSGQLLLSTINDILDFSKIEAGRLHLEHIQFSLGEVIANLINATAQRAHAKGLELVLYQAPTMPDQLFGDPFRIQQILVNLVGNAIKFTEHGSVEVLLETRSISAEQLLLCVRVRDTGIGIAREHAQKVFLPFEQERDSHELFSEGTGLGLAICKRLVDAMAGNIGVESELGKGSVFHFDVPVGVVADVQHMHWLRPDHWEQCPALVWVSHQSVRESIMWALSSFGFKPYAAMSANDAEDWSRDKTDGQSACLLVMDEQLIGFEGPKLSAALATRRDASTIFTLYVISMFNHDRGELDRLDNLPNTGYVMKPVHMSALFNALQIVFGYSSKPQQLSSKVDDPSWKMLVHRLRARERLSGARILLVEDNLVNQEVAVEALSMAGVQVQIATNGEEAVELVSIGVPFDAVLMDLQMPVMDGFRATQIIRQRYDMASLPIIAMTAGVLFKDRMRSQEVGMNDHVGKPVNMQNLLEVLLKWVKPANPQVLVDNLSATTDTALLEHAQSWDGGVDWARIELPGIKVYKGLALLGDNQKLYFKLLKSFVKAHEQTETELVASLASRDFTTVHRLAHTLKGVATTLGAESLHKQATIVEKDASDGQFDRVRQSVERLIVHLGEVMDSISDLLKSIPLSGRTPSAGDAIPAGSHAAIALFDEILDLLTRSDTRLQDLCVNNEATIRDWFAVSESYEKFMDGVEHYQFEEARNTFLSHAVASEPCDRQSILHI